MEDLVHFLRSFPAEDVRVLHTVVVRFADASVPYTESRIHEEFEALKEEEGTEPMDYIACTNILLDIANLDVGSTPFQTFERVCAEAGIKFTANPDEESSFAETGNPLAAPDTDLLHEMERVAVAFDRNKLMGDVLLNWRHSTQRIKEMEAIADARYKKTLLTKAFSHLHNYYLLQVRKNEELERRAVLFEDWQNWKIVHRCLKKWVLEHRSKQLVAWRDKEILAKVFYRWHERTKQIQEQQQQAEELSSRRAASSMLRVWADKAKERRAERLFYERLDELRGNVLLRKWLRIWKHQAHKKSEAKRYVELQARYKYFKTKRENKITLGFLNKWREKTAERQADAKRADEHYDHVQEQKARDTAHKAITKMYEDTVDHREDEERADRHYEATLIGRLGLLKVDGPWRGPVQKIKEMEAVADEYREIKTQELASKALKKMRNETFMHQRREEDADALLARNQKKTTLGFLHTWRDKALERRGETAAAPITPAARRTQLLAATTPGPVYDEENEDSMTADDDETSLHALDRTLK